MPISIRLLSSAIAAVTLTGHPLLARAQPDSSEAAELATYQKTLLSDSSDYGLLCKASRIAVDLGEFELDDEIRTEDFALAARYARRATVVHSDSADGHFFLARALGRQALTLGAKGKVRFAVAVKAQADTALMYHPDHPGALHVLGVWNAEVMRLSGLERFMARHVLGGKVLGEASWENAQKDLERAVALEPNRITHHLDLGKVYADLKMKDKAREQFQAVLDLPAKEYNDVHYQEDARKQITRL